MVKLFQKLTVSRGGAFAALRRVRNPYASIAQEGFAGVAPQKHSRLASLVAVAILLVSSPTPCAFFLPPAAAHEFVPPGVPRVQSTKKHPPQKAKNRVPLMVLCLLYNAIVGRGSVLVLFADFRHPGTIHAVVNSAYGLCPAHSICDDFLNVFILVGRIGLVTGLEIENLTSFSYVGKT